MRALALALFVLVASCGDDNATAAPDMTAPADLSGGVGPKSCGVDGVMLSCAPVSGNIPCYVCDFAGGGATGVCAKPCSLLAPNCPTGMQCHELGADGGTANYAAEGPCPNFGFCR